VVERRAGEVAELDRQVRELGHAVDPHRDIREIASGVAGSCRECGELLSTDDGFCPACGTPASPRRKRPDTPA
jgi:rubrerythrin